MGKRNFFVQVGRVGVINYGPLSGKYITIVDIVDGNRLLVDGPSTGVPRQVIPTKWVSLTKIVYNVPRSAKTATVAKKITKYQVDKQIAATSWAKKAAVKAKRANMGDFDRFKCMLLKKKRSAIINKATAALVKAARKSGALKK